LLQGDFLLSGLLVSWLLSDKYVSHAKILS
jgi:hypothetical protein